MIIASSSHQRLRRHAAAALLALLPLVAACDSAESKQMKAMAGDYVTVYETEVPAGQTEPFVSERHTLTLRPDGRWIQRIDRRIGTEEATFSDSGAYRVQGTMLALGATEEMPASRMTISGDTLWANASSQMKMAEAVTGVKVNDTGEQAFFVRKR